PGEYGCRQQMEYPPSSVTPMGCYMNSFAMTASLPSLPSSVTPMDGCMNSFAKTSSPLNDFCRNVTANTMELNNIIQMARRTITIQEEVRAPGTSYNLPSLQSAQFI